jgi:hypothetical protein
MKVKQPLMKLDENEFISNTQQTYNIGKAVEN